MLRPTESAIIFIQQLGRGLRKVEGKSYLTVIDFIGNYENNYLIPLHCMVTLLTIKIH
jgi:superfamily II DNA or RNA helicase